MRPIGPVRLHHENHGGAVRILLTGKAGQLDDNMGLVNDAAQQVGGAFGSGCISFEILPRLENNLLGGHCPSGMPAHAIGKDGHQRSLTGGMGKDSRPVLLLGTVPRVLGNTGFRLVALLGGYRVRCRE